MLWVLIGIASLKQPMLLVLIRIALLREITRLYWNEPPHDKTNKMTCVPSKDSDQPGHLPSLIRVFTVRSMGSEGPKVFSCRQRRLWSDWANAQADLSLCLVHRSFCWFCRAVAQILITVFWSYEQSHITRKPVFGVVRSGTAQLQKIL